MPCHDMPGQARPGQIFMSGSNLHTRALPRSIINHYKDECIVKTIQSTGSSGNLQTSCVGTLIMVQRFIVFCYCLLKSCKVCFPCFCRLWRLETQYDTAGHDDGPVLEIYRHSDFPVPVVFRHVIHFLIFLLKIRKDVDEVVAHR